MTKYKVVKIGRISCRKTVLRKNLTRDEAVLMVKSFPSSSRSMVVFYAYEVKQ
jgi:hypothetical protein